MKDEYVTNNPFEGSSLEELELGYKLFTEVQDVKGCAMIIEAFDKSVELDLTDLI